MCLGNICRSPLAEALFKHKVEHRNLEAFLEIDSCGTAGYHIGEPPDFRTIRNALKNGVKIDHLGRQLAEEDLEYYDYILAMDHSNYDNILRLPNASGHRNKIRLMREFDPDNRNAEVPDPYYGGEKGFQEVFDILNRSSESFLDHLVKEHRFG